MKVIKELWRKKPFKYGVMIAGAIALLMIVAQLNGWLTAT